MSYAIAFRGEGTPYFQQCHRRIQATGPLGNSRAADERHRRTVAGAAAADWARAGQTFILRGFCAATTPQGAR